jgi:hypothetical protein
MKRIQYFKLFETRSTKLSEDEFNKLVKTKCSDFLSNPKLLQRIKGNYDGDYSYINPKVSHRNPLMKEDGGGVFSSHHTLLMDNLPSWKGFPKRTQSLIGSTNITIDPVFGSHYYFVIPYDGAIFSVAPGSDLWASACNIGNVKYQFDDYFSEVFLQAQISDSSYESMMKDLQDLYNTYMEDKNILTEEVSDYLLNIFETANKEGITDIKLAFSEFFAPNKFTGFSHRDINTGFVLMDYSDISSLPEPMADLSRNVINSEFWTDSECLIVYCGQASKMTGVDMYQKFLDITADIRLSLLK